MDSRNQQEVYWRWAAVTLTVIACGFGCSPLQMFTYFMHPFDQVPAKCKLESPSKEPTVVIATFPERVEQRPEYQDLDRELSERLAAALKDRFKENKEKIKIVPTAKVHTHMDQSMRALDKYELGKHFDADYVIAMEIQKVSLYERGRQMYRGHTDITVTVLDLRKPKGENTIYEEDYTCEHPKNWGTDLNCTPAQFRGQFLKQVAHELSRRFAAYPTEERLE